MANLRETVERFGEVGSVASSLLIPSSYSYLFPFGLLPLFLDTTRTLPRETSLATTFGLCK